MRQFRIALLTRPMEGGMKKHVLQLVQGLNKNLFSIHLIGPAYLLKETDVKLIANFPLELEEGFNPKLQVSQLISLCNYLRKNKIDLLHCHGVQAGLVGRPAAWLAKTPVNVCTFHNLVYDRPYAWWQRKAYSLINRFLSWKTDQFITVSHALEGHLLKQEGLPSARIRVIYNGLEAEPYNAFKLSPTLPLKEGPLVGMIGRFVPEKGADLFLECASIIAKREPHIKFWIIGDGPQRYILEERANELGLTTRVKFLGFRDDIPAILQSLDVVVVPSRSEGLSMVTLEAMASAKPIAAFAVGALPEVIISGVTGLLAPALDTSALADAVLSLLNNKTFADYLGHNGLVRVREQFSVSRMIEETEAVYLRTLNACNILQEE